MERPVGEKNLILYSEKEEETKEFVCYKVTYLRDKMYFDTFEEMKNYYDYPDARDIMDLQDKLDAEYEGDAYPIISELTK